MKKFFFGGFFSKISIFSSYSERAHVITPYRSMDFRDFEELVSRAYVDLFGCSLQHSRGESANEKIKKTAVGTVSIGSRLKVR